MNKIPRNQVPSHADFDLAPLGMWAIGRDANKSIPGEPRLRRLAILPNPFVAEAVALHGEGRRAHEKSPGAPRNFGSGSAFPANPFSETTTT
jgi:hypothetical protein